MGIGALAASVASFDPGARSERPALRSVATVFLRRRPIVVAPMFVLFVATSAATGAPRGQVVAVSVVALVALGLFAWEAWRGRRRLVSARRLAVSLAMTLVGITVGAALTGGTASPLVLMAFAPTVIGFAAFGRGRVSDALLALAVASFAGLALLPGVVWPPLPEASRRFLLVICGADALLLLRLGVAALTDAHAAASDAAAGAGDDVVAGATARAAALEAMGAKVAHEVRNPLAAIRGLVEVIAERPGDERDQKRLAVVLGEVARIDEILQGYLALARPLDQLAPRPADAGQLVREVAAVIEARAARAGVTVLVEAAPALASFDPRRMKEALLNLVLNAIDATPAGGRIVIGAARAGASIVFSVADSGIGMDDERLARAGRPFASGRAEGTGLGLALARQAIEQHGGRLELASRPGVGTTARLHLPLEAK